MTTNDSLEIIAGRWANSLNTAQVPHTNIVADAGVLTTTITIDDMTVDYVLLTNPYGYHPFAWPGSTAFYLDENFQPAKQLEARYVVIALPTGAKKVR